ncbi:MAG: hypothetical protein QM759_14480 [Terricaulis sp.]
MRTFILALAALALSACATTPARPATEVSYAADLNVGDTNSGSTATAHATVDLDMAAQMVSACIVVHGIHMSDLAAHLAHAPMGSIHLHLYKPDGDVVLVYPFPMGDSYAETPDGFTVTVTNAPYAAGAAILHSELSFADFKAALDSGRSF